jgi:hypothetical protein
LTLFIDAHASISVPSTEKCRRQKLLDLGLAQQRRKELGRDVALQQPVTVLGEHRMVPRRVIDADTHEPAEQKIVFQPLHEQPLRADRVERLQQHRPQQLLRWDRRSPDRRIERGKLSPQPGQSLVHDQPNGTQRMIAPYPRLQIHIAEQLATSIVVPAHPSPSESLLGQ